MIAHIAISLILGLVAGFALMYAWLVHYARGVEFECARSIERFLRELSGQESPESAARFCRSVSGEAADEIANRLLLLKRFVRLEAFHLMAVKHEGNALNATLAFGASFSGGRLGGQAVLRARRCSVEIQELELM